jgi:hypothetical protein
MLLKPIVAMPEIGAISVLILKLSAKHRKQPSQEKKGEDPSWHLDMFYILCNTFN